MAGDQKMSTRKFQSVLCVDDDAGNCGVVQATLKRMRASASIADIPVIFMTTEALPTEVNAA